MDESALHDRLDRIERRLSLALALLVVPYLFGVAELLGYWTAGVLFTTVGMVALAVVGVQRRRAQGAAGQ